MKEKLSGLVLPGLFVVAWIYALSGSTPPGALTGDSMAVLDLRWLLYFAGYVFLFSSVMHSVFAKGIAKSIGWKTNGFQYELAFASLGLGLGCFYSVYQGIEALTAISIPIIVFLFLAGVNHVREMIQKKN